MEEWLRENRELWELLEVIALLKDSEEASKFFRDLCTAAELETLAERWQVARMIEQKIPYRTISRETGASTATITRVAHWLRRGEGGYRLIMDRLIELNASKAGAREARDEAERE